MKLLEEFDSFEIFQTAFEKYCDESFQCFTTTDSRYNKDKSVQYKHFKCVHHHDPENVKSKSKGVRPNQHYVASGCQAEVRVRKKLKFERF